jgi:hypothetical protein
LARVGAGGEIDDGEVDETAVGAVEACGVVVVGCIFGFFSGSLLNSAI